MYKLYIFSFYSIWHWAGLSRARSLRQWFWSGCHPCKIHPKGDCLWQIHSHSSRMLHLSSSTLIPQGCCPCQIHAYLLWLLPLPDPPLFLMAVIPARSTLISYGCYPCQIHPHFLWLSPLPDRPLFAMAATPARSTFICYGCYTCQIHPYF